MKTRTRFFLPTFIMTAVAGVLNGNAAFAKDLNRPSVDMLILDEVKLLVGDKGGIPIRAMSPQSKCSYVLHASSLSPGTVNLNFIHAICERAGGRIVRYSPANSPELDKVVITDLGHTGSNEQRTVTTLPEGTTFTNYVWPR